MKVIDLDTDMSSNYRLASYRLAEGLGFDKTGGFCAVRVMHYGLCFDEGAADAMLAVLLAREKK